ncbi:MAG TPA: hypothetical protein VLI90_07550 [Tepidisphaeraceae bacterium]|nr:hypothetical protein [Tepidisphaeraceae bacterium]
MSAGSPNSTDVKMLPDAATSPPPPPPPPVVVAPAPAPTPSVVSTAIASTSAPSRQLSELPKDELESLAQDFGLDPTRYKTRQHLVAALHERRQLIAGLDRDAMIDVVRWGRRPVTVNASKEQIAQEIARIRSMKFSGLSHRGLIVLAMLRGVAIRENDSVPALIRKLRRQEGFFSKINRKRRAALGSLVSKMVGEDEAEREYQFLPPPASGPTAGPTAPPPPRPSSLKEEIEESGLVGGLTNRIKKTADSYLNQKLDEIESRIDRKLDEIDRRLAEWRDKEIANRIRILKITLWASVIVGAFSLVYSYVKVYLVGH